MCRRAEPRPKHARPRLRSEEDEEPNPSVPARAGERREVARVSSRAPRRACRARLSPAEVSSVRVIFLLSDLAAAAVFRVSAAAPRPALYRAMWSAVEPASRADVPLSAPALSPRVRSRDHPALLRLFREVSPRACAPPPTRYRDRLPRAARAHGPLRKRAPSSLPAYS